MNGADKSLALSLEVEQKVAPRPEANLALDWATVRVLWSRDVVRFFRQKSRVLGALAQPLIFWLVIGTGFSGSFHLSESSLDYRAFFFPGVVTMVLLFSAIFATITVIEDRQAGFLQCVLAGPGARWAVVLGKSLGSTTIALIQAGLLLAFAPLAGVEASNVRSGLLVAVLFLSALAFTAVGFALAWSVSSSTGYHAVMSVLLIPLWVVSGGMFPIRTAGPVLGAVMAVNPMRFSVDGVRRALYGDGAVAATTGSGDVWLELACLAGFAAFFLALSAFRVGRRE